MTLKKIMAKAINGRKALTTMKKEILKLFCILLASITVGYLMLVGAYFIKPSNISRQRFAESSAQIQSEGVYPVDTVSNRMLDNFTDALILLECSYNGNENAFIKAANTPFQFLTGAGPFESIGQIDQAPKARLRINNYSRYWHGYQVILRPLLCLFNYSQLRKISSFMLAILITLITMLLINKLPRCVIPFIISVILLAPTAVAKSLQFTNVPYISLLSILLILWNPGKIRENGKMKYLFLLSGILVAYFDLFTFPLLSLTLPLALLCMFKDQRENRKLLKNMILCTVYWGIGFAGM